MCLSYSDQGILEKIKEPKPFLDCYLAAIKLKTALHFKRGQRKVKVCQEKKMQEINMHETEKS